MGETLAAPSVSPLGDGRYLVTTGDVQRTAYAVTGAGAVWVFLDGDVWVVRPEGSPRHAGHGQDESLAAPMPARVLAVAVQPGQAVSAGEALLTLEAMKMELPIRAPRDGVVRTVSCQTGQMVAAGAQLVELE